MFPCVTTLARVYVLYVCIYVCVPTALTACALGTTYLHPNTWKQKKKHENACLPCNSDKEKFQIDYKDEAIRGVLAVDAGNVTWPAPQKPPPPAPAAKAEAEVSHEP